MRTLVSHGTSYGSEGQKLCCKCQLRPRVAGQRWCRTCKTDYERDRRAGTIQVQLTPAEWAAVKQLRAAAAGR